MKRSKASILVVDDEPDLRGMLENELSHEGFDVSVASSGEAALEMARGRSFDVTITDLKMPGMDGVETVAALKVVDPSMEIIVATGYASIDTAIDCMKNGAYDYIRKPFELREIIVLVEKALEKKQLSDAVGLYQASQALLATLSYPELVTLVLERARNIFSAAEVVLLLRSEQERPHGVGTLHTAGTRTLSTRTQRAIVQQVDNDCTPALWNGGLVKQPSLSELPEAAALQSAIVLPLHIGEARMGALALLRRIGQPDYTVAEQRQASVLAAQSALAFDNARLYRDLERLAITDELTGLYSRRFLLEAMRKQIKLGWRRGPEHASFMLVDVDHFRRLNERKGHLEADRILCAVGRSIGQIIRESDIAARFTGDRFAIFMPGADSAGSNLVAERIREKLRADRAADGVTLSIGIACSDGRPHQTLAAAGGEQAPNEAHATAMLIERADKALVRAKSEGRDRAHVFRAEIAETPA